MPLETSQPTRDTALSWLRLTLVPGVTPGMQRNLLAAFGSPDEILGAPGERVDEAAGHRAAAQLLGRGPDAKLLEKTLRWLDEHDCHLVTLGDARYPELLTQIADPPTALYVRGRVELLRSDAFAIVGSRNATPQGLRDAECFAHALSDAGLTIASGLALGIDAAAHRGGLAGRGSTIALMGTGIDRIYPRANRNLAHAIAASGCLVSEYPLGMHPAAGNFPRRNRLISGLARGVLVVEAGMPSGSLVTAKSAAEQGRDVFAIPGSIHAPHSKGCHWLIKEGAKLVESAADVLHELGWSVSTPLAQAPIEPHLPDPLLDVMGCTPMSIDQLARHTGLDAAKLAAHLTRLEIEGRVAVLAGGWFQRTAVRDIE